jgi:hypothetical protein
MITFHFADWQNVPGFDALGQVAVFRRSIRGRCGSSFATEFRGDGEAREQIPVRNGGTSTRLEMPAGSAGISGCRKVPAE